MKREAVRSVIAKKTKNLQKTKRGRRAEGGKIRHWGVFSFRVKNPAFKKEDADTYISKTEERPFKNGQKGHQKCINLISWSDTNVGDNDPTFTLQCSKSTRIRPYQLITDHEGQKDEDVLVKVLATLVPHSSTKNYRKRVPRWSWLWSQYLELHMRRTT